jgi:hypothetical protein
VVKKNGFFFFFGFGFGFGRSLFFFLFFFNVAVQKWTVSLFVLSMEDAKSNASDTVPKDPPPPPQTHSSKRKLSHVDLTNSSYFKIRAAVQQLRPKVFQVLSLHVFWPCFLQDFGGFFSGFVLFSL